MKKRTIFAGCIALLAAGAYAAYRLLDVPIAEADEDAAGEDAAEEPSAPTVDADKTVAFPLRNKLVDHSRGETAYIFELETPDGVKEVEVTEAHYETYGIGDEVICLETESGPEIV